MDPIYYPIISLPIFVALLGLYALLSEEAERQRLAKLTERLADLYRQAGQSGLRARRIKRFPFAMHLALRQLDQSVKALERRQQIRSRRPSISLTDNKPVLDNLEERIGNLEKAKQK